MKPIPDVEWNGIPLRDDDYGYHFIIHTDDRNNVANWMVEAEVEIKNLRNILSDVEEELDEDHCHQAEYCDGCAICIIEKGLKELECEHQWISADNEVVSGAEICTICKTIRPKDDNGAEQTPKNSPDARDGN